MTSNMMVFLRFDLVLAILAAVGLGSSYACTQQGIMTCMGPMTAYGQNAPKKFTPEVCEILEDAGRCLDRETASCPSRMDSIIKVAKSGLNTYLKICRDPDSVDVEALANCDAKKINKCRDEVQMSGRTKKARCLAMKKAEKCLNDFRKDCDSDLMDDLLDGVNDVIKDYESNCPEDSYETRNGGGSGGENGSRQLQSTALSFLAAAMLVYLRYFS